MATMRSFLLSVVFVSFLALQAHSQALSRPESPETANLVFQWGKSTGYLSANVRAGSPASEGNNFGFGIGKSSTSTYDTRAQALDQDFDVLPIDGKRIWHASTPYWTVVAVQSENLDIRWFWSGSSRTYEDAYAPVTLPTPIDITDTLSTNLTRNAPQLVALAASECTIVAAVNQSTPSGPTLYVYTWQPFESDYSCGSPSTFATLGRKTDRKISKILTSFELAQNATPVIACGAGYCLASDSLQTVIYWGNLGGDDDPPTNLFDMPTFAPGEKCILHLAVSPYFVLMQYFDQPSAQKKWKIFGSFDSLALQGVPNGVSSADVDSAGLPTDYFDLQCGIQYCLAIIPDNSFSDRKFVSVGNGRAQLALLSGASSSSTVDDSYYLNQNWPDGAVPTKIGIFASTSFLLFNDSSLHAAGLNQANSITAGISFAMFGRSDVLYGEDGLFYKIPLPINCEVLEPPSCSSAPSVEGTPTVTARCKTSGDPKSVKKSFAAPKPTHWTLATLNHPDGMNAFIAWGATAARSLDYFRRPAENIFANSGLDDSVYGIPLANASLKSGSLYAEVPYIVDLPYEDYKFTRLVFSKNTAYATATKTLSDQYTNSTAPELFAWGAMKQAGSSGNTRSHSVIPWSLSADDLVLDVTATSAKIDSTYSPNGFANRLRYFASAEKFSCAVIASSEGGRPSIEGSSDSAELYCAGELNETPIGGAFSRIDDSGLPPGTAPIPEPSHDLGSIYDDNMTLADAKMQCGGAHCAFLSAPSSVLTWASPSLSLTDMRLCRDPQEGLNIHVASIPGEINFISVGYDFTVLIVAKAYTYVCANNESDILTGASVPLGSFSVFVGNLPTGSEVVSIASGYAHTILLTYDRRTIYSFGNNFYGQTGNGGITKTSSFGAMDNQILASSDISSVACVRYTSYAILEDGSVFAWGENSFLKIFGDFSGSSDVHSTNVPILASLSSQIKLDTKVKAIVSSPFSRTVFALANLKPISSTRQEPPPLRLFKFGIDQNQQYLLSPTEPSWYDTAAEIQLPMLTLGESVTMVSTHYPVTWIATSSMRIFSMNMNGTAGGAETKKVFNAPLLDSKEALRFSPSPRLHATYMVSGATFKKIRALGTEGLVALISNPNSPDVTLSLFGNGASAPDIVGQGQLINKFVKDFDCSALGCFLQLSEDGRNLFLWAHGAELGLNDLPSGATAFAMLQEEVQVSGYSDPALAIVTYRNGSISLWSPTATYAYGFAPIGNYITQLSISSNYLLLLDDMGYVWGASWSNFATPNSYVFHQLVSPCVGNATAWIHTTITTRFVKCQNGSIYALGMVPPQNSFLETWNASSQGTAALDHQHWSKYQNFTRFTKLTSFERMKNELSVQVTGIAGDMFETSSTPDNFAFYAWTSPPTTPMEPTNGPPISCVPASPPTPGPQWKCNLLTNNWEYVGDLVLSGGDTVVIKGTTVVSGNLTISGSTSLVIVLPTGFNDKGGPLLNVSGCFSSSTPITVEISDSDVKKIGKDPKKVLIIESGCTGVFSGLKSKLKTTGCKQYSTKTEKVKTKNGREQLFAVFQVSKDTCNNWWIILVSVVGAVLLLAIIAAIVILATPLRQKVLPYRDSQGRRRKSARAKVAK